MDKDVGFLAQDKNNLTHSIPDKRHSRSSKRLWGRILSFGSWSFYKPNTVLQNQEDGNVLPKQHKPPYSWISAIKRNSERIKQLNNSRFFF